MADHDFSLRTRFLHNHPPATSSSSLADMRSPEPQKLRVLVAANGSKDVAQALALVVRLSKHPKIETRAVIDEESWPAHRLSQETLALRNISFKPANQMNEVDRSIERSQIEFFKQQANELCEWADMMVLAPIDADTFAKMLHGVADCFLLEILRGWDVSKKILLVPGMTTTMWENPMTKKQLSKVRRKWQWVRVMQPILWQYEGKGSTRCMLGWDGFNELVDVIKNQAELMAIGHDVDNASAGAAELRRHDTKSDIVLPAEIWTLIFDYVGDWEVATALHIYTNLPTPSIWQRKANEPKDEFYTYMKSLEWTILTSPVPRMIDKLKAAPDNMTFLSSLCVKLVIKFCLVDLLTYLETNLKDVFWSSFGQKLLPTKASAVYGRTEILEWWRTSASFLSKDYTAEAMDGASQSGFIHVLDWWRRSGLPLKYTESSMEQASSKGHVLVLEWWKQASMIQGGHSLDSESPARNVIEEGTSTSQELPPALELKPGKSLLAAAQNNKPHVLRWWDSSGIQVGHSESVARVASQHGHVAVLETWKDLNDGKMAFDCRVLVEPTKNGHVNVLEWWKNFSRGEDGRPGARVEYKTCDIEEALEDSIGSEGVAFAVKKWWAQNGLNLGVQVREWTRVKVL